METPQQSIWHEPRQGAGNGGGQGLLAEALLDRVECFCYNLLRRELFALCVLLERIALLSSVVPTSSQKEDKENESETWAS